MGERARTDSVRPGAEKADVSAEFALRKDSELHQTPDGRADRG